MTMLIGLRLDDQIIIAADHAVSTGLTRLKRKDNKIVTLANGEFITGGGALTKLSYVKSECVRKNDVSCIPTLLTNNICIDYTYNKPTSILYSDGTTLKLYFSNGQNSQIDSLGGWVLPGNVNKQQCDKLNDHLRMHVLQYGAANIEDEFDYLFDQASKMTSTISNTYDIEKKAI